MKHAASVFLIAVCMALAAPLSHADTSARWSKSRIDAWYAKQPWIVGSNYVPANAINELEMWQAATFDPQRIDKELGWAQNLGMTTMRVFLHNLPWQKDPHGFKERIRTFLKIAAKHHIKPIFVLFDSVWDPDPKLGPQHPPIPGVHNSGWVQAPGAKMLDNPSSWPKLEAYVKDLVGTFAHDKRVLAWDVWNEPDNPGGGDYGAQEPKDKIQRVATLLPKVFAWARSQHPDQPLTSAVWHEGSWAKSNLHKLNAVERTQLTQSDVISFHEYNWPVKLLKRIKQLRSYGRPIICTEYMARSAGSTIDNELPIGKRLNVGMVNWGFVKGRTQTNLPWNSWQRPYTLEQPTVWFHDLLHADGTPYRKREAQIIKLLTHTPKGQVPMKALTPAAGMRMRPVLH